VCCTDCQLNILIKDQTVVLVNYLVHFLAVYQAILKWTSFVQNTSACSVRRWDMYVSRRHIWHFINVQWSNIGHSKVVEVPEPWTPNK
jgi:hypothetical protein